jgi:uncharacterized cupin superfamily protein
MVEHAALARRMAWLTRTYGVQPDDRSALATQATFDPSLIELCLPLVNGASIALAPPGRLRPESVAEFAIRHGVTIMAFVPSTLSGFLDAAAHRPGLRLRVACCGGEVLSPELAARYREGTSARLFNVYGPTEACIFATAWACVPDSGHRVLPIGTPVAQLRGRVISSNPDGSEAGVWECSPGTWVRQVMDAEIATFFSGHAVFTPEGGEAFDILPGDVVFFPANSKGVWEIRETTRKSYLTYKAG